MQIEISDSLADISADEWNALHDGSNPFVRHEFLSALERNHCVSAEHGWHPYHLLLKNDKDQLIAAAPSYLKTNSYGEFVFDFAWAEAYQRSGQSYYPKLVCAVPFTPATGPRLLVKPGEHYDHCASALLSAAIAVVDQQNLSGVHWLFPTDAESKKLVAGGYMERMGCQYIWANNEYSDFEDFLSHCTSKKRKNLRRERKRVSEQEVTLQVMHGRELNTADWNDVTGFYLDTFNRKWGNPTLNQPFFAELGNTMGEDIIIVFATHNEKRVACSVMLKGTDTLFGRYWGCSEDFHSLHFEACYYQGIDYCIANGLKRFEPGAQGEHKIGRGFVPTPTWSAHYLRNENFSQAVRQFLKQERPLMEQHCEALHALLPFKEKDLNS
ncbi:GNAT family N-acetyltransferase [Chromatiales bacterium (ex Bugula neritina AB1)]|nr:GNAT family N-acetyltransferase [Chromatiales bacterium (ex Bugula neritina AB1)]